NAAMNWISATDTTALYQRDSSLNYWFQYLSESQTLYVKYNRCVDASNLMFSSFAAKLLAFIDVNPVGRIVIDLRNNSGGNSSLVQPLVDGLIQRVLSGQIRMDTPAFVIIGRETFSSGLINAIQFQSSGAKVVGEPSGGKPNAYGEVKSFSLPRS